MTELTERLNKEVDVTLAAQLHKEMDLFENFFTRFTSDGTSSNIRMDTSLSDASAETSDDTKEIECRPKKRNEATVTNNLFYSNKDHYKRNRPSEVPIDSSAVAGFSRT
ncbi:unnamed protein product [Rhizophagus irregularis]|uniref:Uncharacterized protein n=1 Tax=Rhizophagus irregularis TaxID=588596 RepID=A0A2N1M804_9GLOM|nr:hypothetical protein RhiirC2_797517 [Rhizophagus irregularis]CAB4379891.1 unnamed protein product [Rhizophagus irregularis]